ncbi:MAG: ATP-grasp domain-containing protein, partial [Acidimicrobiales bacterium]
AQARAIAAAAAGGGGGARAARGGGGGGAWVGDLLVEEFVPGPEVAVEGLLRGGRLEVLAVFDKPDPLDGPNFEETIYVTPSRLPALALVAVAGVAASACAALGLVEGPVHAELRVGVGEGAPSGEAGVEGAGVEGAGGPGAGARLIEVAARSIGGLCSRSLSFGTGLSLEQVIVAHALGRPLGDLSREERAAGVMMVPIPAAGVLAGVGGQDEARAVAGITGVEISIPIGRPVVPLPEGDRYLGFLFAKGDTPEEVEAALRRAHAGLDVRIEPASG